MRFFILLSLVATSFAVPQGYNLPSPSSSFQHGLSSPKFIGSSIGQSTVTGSSVGHTSFAGSSAGHTSFGGGSVGHTSSGSQSHGGSCGGGQVRHVGGRCVTPTVNRNIFVYEAPRQQQIRPAASVPRPRVDYNFVFVRTSEFLASQRPVVVPPPQQKTIVYVLNKNAQIGGQRVIEVPHTSEQPEVYYVNYNDGDNPTLPGGIDLQTALKTTASQQGQVIGGGSGLVTGGTSSIVGTFGTPSGQYGVP